MTFLLIFWIACLLDIVLGDPRWLPHPVRFIGLICTKTEAFARSLPVSVKSMGLLTVLFVVTATATGCSFVLMLSKWVGLPLFWFVSAIVLYTTIAARDLVGHATAVHLALDRDLDEAQQCVAMIVGRDTSGLDQVGIIRACVESVSENMSDGIVAPLFWATSGAVFGLAFAGVWPVWCGVTAAMVYKSVNTMDSMFGYTNEQYKDFGFVAAKLDDMANYLPARFSALAISAAACMSGSGEKSLQIALRDHGKHASPNGGWPEAAAAGALGIQLGGDACYFGKMYSKPLLGDDLCQPVAADILRANRLIVCASVYCAGFFSLVYAALVLAVG